MGAGANPAGGGAASTAPIQANKIKKIDINKQGLSSVKNSVVKKNLMGVSESMTKKDWKDSQGRKGKVPPPPPFSLLTLTQPRREERQHHQKPPSASRVAL